MSLEETIRRELLIMRKQRDGTTPEALVHAEALNSILGNGDPRVAYNSLKHVVLSHGDLRSVMAAAYSLGFASDGATHLDRLTEFGADNSYDQRQARRYSDRGIAELASYIAKEWTVEASPELRAQILRADDIALEVVLTTEHLSFIEMQPPLVEAVVQGGERDTVDVTWHETAGSRLRGITNVVIEQNNRHPALSVCWLGELWPQILLDVPLAGGAQNRLLAHNLGNRLQIEVSHPISEC